MKRKRLAEAALLSSLLVVLSLPAACAPREGSAAETEEKPQTGSQIPTGLFAGNVVETMDAGSYTYVSLERNGERIWAAGPRTAVSIGDEMTVALDMRMEGFRSESLDREFDAVYFVSSFDAGPAAGGDVAAGNPHSGLAQLDSGADAPPIDLDSIEKPEGGSRIGELWDRRDSLAGKEVVVRGRVVKYHAAILGRNWLHLQDGSGDPAKGTHDLAVTSEGSAGVGDLVTVRGVVSLDRDFGAGYLYGLIVENASVEAE